MAIGRQFHVSRKRSSAQAFGYNASTGWRARSGIRLAAPFSYTTTNNKTKSGVGTTTQRDVRVQYVKRRMPRRKRRQWKKFMQKYKAAAVKSLGSSSIVYNNSFVMTQTGAISQVVGSVFLKSCNGTSTGVHGACNDLSLLLGNMGITNNGKFLLNSACLDVTLNNTSSVKLEVDLYEVVFVGRAVRGSSLAADWSQAETQTPTAPGATALASSTRGVTMFQFPFLGKLGYKVIKKTKVYLPELESMNYQIRDSKNRFLTYNSIGGTNTTTFAKSGLTQGLIIVMKNVVGTAVDAVSSLSVGFTRTYNGKVLSQSVDYDGQV